MNIRITDVTLREGSLRRSSALSFRERIEIAKALDKLGADVIEAAAIEDVKTDSLALRTIGALLKHSVLSCDAGTTRESVEMTAKATESLPRRRLLVSLPVSAVQMEYLRHKKPEGMIETIGELVGLARSLCDDVEFAALDATRAEPAFLIRAVKTATDAGAGTVTLCDTAGIMLPDGWKELVSSLIASGAVGGARVCAECSDALGMAAANSFACVSAGASAVKTSVGSANTASLSDIARVMAAKGQELSLSCTLDMTSVHRGIATIARFTDPHRSKEDNPFDTTAGKDDRAGVLLDAMSELEDVKKAVVDLGYDLSDDDMMNVWDAFRRVADKKKVGTKELDAIVASAAMQVPATYTLESYIINSGKPIDATAVVVLEKNGRKERAVSVGDGPIDAAFLAIEQLCGHHYELDEFEIRAVTEGAEAVGDALVKLRSGGRLYSGRGISTDVIGASIRAYVNALNKIVYEEENA